MTDAISARLPGAMAARGWTAAAAATTGLVFGPSTILVFLFGSFIGPLEQAFGWSRLSILFAATIVSLMIMVVSPLQGILVDRFGARPVVLLSNIAFAAGLALLAWMPSDIRFYYLMYGLLPILAIGLWPASYLRVVSTWFDRRLGLAIGIANGGIGLGAALLPLLISYLVDHADVRSAYLGLAAIVLLVTLPVNVLLLHEATPTGRQEESTFAAGFSVLRSVVKNGNFILLAVAFFLLGIVNAGLLFNQISILVDGGMTAAQAAVVQSVFGLSVLFGRFLIGALLDYVAANKLMSVACLGGALACALYAIGATGAMAFVCAVLIGAIYGAEFDVLSYIIKRLLGVAVFGRVYGIIFAVFQLGSAFGTTVLPFSKAQLGGYGPGLAAYAVILILVALLFVRLSLSGAKATEQRA
jgi:MFS family permease